MWLVLVRITEKVSSASKLEMDRRPAGRKTAAAFRVTALASQERFVQPLETNVKSCLPSPRRQRVAAGALTIAAGNAAPYPFGFGLSYQPGTPN
jgi:hypothetical protein